MTAHGGTGRRLFRDDGDFEQFLSTFARVSASRDWSVRSYCLLNTHYHLLLDTPHGDIAAGMQFLNGRYAEWVNASRGEKGHVFRERYNAVLVSAPGHLIELYRYLALNPVRAMLCSRAEVWPWSSYAQLLGVEPARPFLAVRQALRDFADKPVQARERLRAFVDDVSMPSPQAPSERAA